MANHSFNNISMNWNYPTPIRFGAGRIRELAEACASLGMNRPLLITDRGLANSEIVQRAVQVCLDNQMPCAVFSEVQGNPIGDNVTAGVKAYRDGDHDGVIAFGGGSGLDAAKAIALMVGQNRPLWDFEDKEDWYTRVNVKGMAPVVAVPTTSGTGSEVGRCSVITDLSDHTKKIIFHPNMLPGLVIADPELTIGLPAHLTAAVGMDALSHNLEALCSPLYHPMGDGIALEGIKLVDQSLLGAYHTPTDLESRSHMIVASTMGATAFQKGLGAMHSMSHPCGAVLNTHHGLTNAVVMPYVLMYNRKENEEKLTSLCRYLGLSNPSGERFLEWTLSLREQLKIPHTLADLGVSQEHISDLASRALVDPTAPTNPRTLTQADLEKLFDAAIRGDLDAATCSSSKG
ncbi:MAG: alcohol dehydrogenase [Myxococcales bacterium]|nr:alcohol dehydrogenase [Myxococcales bacterium]